MIKSFGGFEKIPKVNFSELSDKKLMQLKRSLERLIRGKLFFKNYFLDRTLGKYFTIIFRSKGLKAKIINLLKFKFDRDLTPELNRLKYRYI